MIYIKINFALARIERNKKKKKKLQSFIYEQC